MTTSGSAFIPFCGFGEDMEAMGVKIDQFDIPVCNSFKDKLLNDQLCYEVDLNKLFNKTALRKGLKIGLIFILDYNEDRQVSNTKTLVEKKKYDLNDLVKLDDNFQSMIIVDTIGMILN